jgi:gamma-glutamyltranspeptidase / glutathione hydrolase / leukotriene-C4 hydrolase
MSITEAIDSLRLHDQLWPNQIEYEEGYHEQVLASLVARGHVLKRLPRLGSDHRGTVQAIVRLPNGVLEAVADRRKGGKASGY